LEHPQTANPARTASGFKTDRAAASKATVLLLDDEERVVETLRMILRPFYNVLTATEGQAALQLLLAHKVQVIISDQRMPNMTGVEFLRKARQISPASVRILLTGFSDLKAIIDSVNEGEVFRFLNKPWGNAELLSVVTEAVEVARQIDTVAPDVKQSLAENAQVQIPEAASEAAHAEQPAATAAAAAARHHHLPPVTKGVVLVKTPNRTLYDQIILTLPQGVACLHAATLDEALAVLERHPVNVLVAHFDKVADAQNEALAFKLLKRDFPALISIALIRNTDANDLISMINQARVFRCATLPCKASLVSFFIVSALRQHQTHLAAPQLLQTQRAERFDVPAQATSDGRSDPATTGLLSRIGSICKRWLGAPAASN
jgi:serine/threonine-protein kinase